MFIQIDFESEEALYVQLRNQIIYGIALGHFHEGDALPSVRQLAEMIGINMHTVNKAYAALRSEGLLRLDRRRGAVIAIDMDKVEAITQTKEALSLILARAYCKGITREETHRMIDDLYDSYAEGTIPFR